MTRVPSINPERDRLIAFYEKRLRYFQGISPHRREDECADEGEQTCRAILAELRKTTGRE